MGASQARGSSQARGARLQCPTSHADRMVGASQARGSQAIQSPLGRDGRRAREEREQQQRATPTPNRRRDSARSKSVRADRRDGGSAWSQRLPDRANRRSAGATRLAYGSRPTLGRRGTHFPGNGYRGRRRADRVGRPCNGSGEVSSASEQRRTCEQRRTSDTARASLARTSQSPPRVSHSSPRYEGY